MFIKVKKRVVGTLIIVAALCYASSIQAEEVSPERKRAFDVQHYTIRLSFNRKSKMVFGDSTIRFAPLRPGLGSIVLNARKIKFHSVRLEGEKRQLKRKVLKNKVIIFLDRDYSPKESVSVRIGYTAKPKKGIYFVKSKRNPGQLSHSSQIWTQGESQETHHWLPSYDFPDDKATTEQYITVKTGETVIGNGVLVSKKENPDGTTTFHHKMSLPHSLYLTSFIVGRYEKVSERYNGIPINYYVYPGQKSIVNKAYGKTIEMFKIFEELTGIPYPFTKYDQTMVANFPLGGMENITATTMSDTEIMLAKHRSTKSIVEDLVAHELAHSWFGNLVTCKNWSELWLNEGFATFMESVIRENFYGRKNYIKNIEKAASMYFAYESGFNFRQHGLYNRIANPKDESTIFDPITYQKGGAVIHTLREEIGDMAFWNGVNLYLTRHKFANVETSDLINAMEKSSKRNLGWFFKQWVYTKGYPQIKVSQVYNRKTKLLKLTFSQKQSVNSTTPFAYILPLELEMEIGAKIVKHKINFRDRRKSFFFKADQKPNRILIDKDLKIPLKVISKSPMIVTDK